MTALAAVEAVHVGPDSWALVGGRGTALQAVPSVWALCQEGLEPAAAEERALALAEGAEGVLYVVEGACPAHTTPMQYGGNYLESDRRVLEALPVPVIVLARGREAYIDILAGLPCAALAWSAVEVGARREDALSPVPAATELGGDYRLVLEELP